MSVRTGWRAMVVLGFAAGAALAVTRDAGMAPRAARLPGQAHLQAFAVPGAARAAAAGKLDATLAELLARSRELVPDPALALRQLRAMNPAARFAVRRADGSPLVRIDAVTRGDPRRLAAALGALGLEHPATYRNDVGGWLPVSRLADAAARAEVHAMRAALSRTRAGAVTTQGDYAQRSDVARSANSLDGSGVTVGVISDSYDCYSQFAADNIAASGPNGYANNGFTADAATDIASGDLPAGMLPPPNLPGVGPGEAPCVQQVNGTYVYTGAPLQLPFGDEGRAMMQILHDVAPGAKFIFHTAENSEADFAAGIGALASAGATVIVDDVGYFDEPFYQDGLVSQAIDAVKARGVPYVTAAGNNGHNAYENTAPAFSTASVGPPGAANPAGEMLLNFDTSGKTTATSLPVSIPALIPGEFIAIVVQWDQPYVTGAPASGGATSRIDVCVTGSSSADGIYNYYLQTAQCTGPNSLGQDPYQVMIVGNPATATSNSVAETINISVGLASGGANAPGRILVAVEDDGGGAVINSALATNSATVQGHSGAAGALSTGAAFYFQTPLCGTTPAIIEPFSSRGGGPILFDANGQRLTAPVVRQKPDLVGPNGGNTTYFGFTLASAGFTNGLLQTTNTSCQNNPSYPNFFGTSAAAPHVAGIIALMLQANPSLTPDQAYSALTQSALSMNGGAPSVDSGVGFVQADAAVKLVPPKPSGGGSGGGTSGSTGTSSGGGGGALDGATLAALAALVLLGRVRRTGRRAFAR